MAKRGGGAPDSARQCFKKAKSVTLLDDTGDDGIATASASSSIPSNFMLAGPKDAETAFGLDWQCLGSSLCNMAVYSGQVAGLPGQGHRHCDILLWPGHARAFLQHAD